MKPLQQELVRFSEQLDIIDNLDKKINLIWQMQIKLLIGEKNETKMS